MKRKSDAGIVVKTFVICAVFILMFAVQSASARKIAGVDVPPSVTIDNKVLVLNGAGIRKKLFIKVYVGALYLTGKRTTTGQILADPGAKSIVMNFLYKEVSAKRTVDGWNKGFADNSTAKEVKALQERINQFNSLFSTVYKGDEIRLDYLPGEGTQVRINGTLKGSVPGEDFYQALLKIWLGPKPADTGLKDDMLGSSY
jgi:hypothetical protein